MGLVQHRGRNRAVQVPVEYMDLRRGALDAVGGVAVRGDVEGFVDLLGPVEVVREREQFSGCNVPIQLAKRSRGEDGPTNRQALFLVAGGAHEVDQRPPLAVRVAVNQGLVRRITDPEGRLWAGRGADRSAQV